MLKARIITASLENAEPLAEQLRKRGCEVEVVRPTDAKVGPVDFEFEMESCPADRALERATELSKQRSADVYVAAGCFPEKGIRPAADAVSAVAPSVVDERVFAEARQKQRDAMARALREKRALMRQARAAQRRTYPGELPPATVEVVPLRSEQQTDSLNDSIHAARKLDPMLARQWAQPVPTPSISPRNRELRVAFGVAAMIAALFMLGWSAVGPNTHPSLPSTPSVDVRATQTLEHELPVNSAVNGSPKLVQSSVSTRSKEVTVRGNAGRAKLDTPSVRHVPNRISRKHADDGLIAEDEVRYFARRATPSRQPSKNPEHASLKHFSDMQ